MPSVTVAIITRNRKKLLEECLRSVLSGTRIPEETRVYDNASDDGTIDMLMLTIMCGLQPWVTACYAYHQMVTSNPTP